MTADILSVASIVGVTLLGGEKGINLLRVKFGKNGNGNGHSKAPSLSEIQVALQESQYHGLTEMRQSIKDSQEPVISALGRIEQINQDSLKQMTRMVTLMENGNGHRVRAKRK